ncbi:hypothetical protein SAMN05216276_1008180 [Streptosporangium subroseum]|uniref:Uncharacterized protein n=1 Tax=Streptosporangium subroseum TaxID=106412 RepID=A0A239E2V0_9ACTN|nr:hypothetical protein [Streptosporangium subroseum]SNS38608.1 hypothetical protein SAMN05216276_1008180 [Streptosporangium subroseum]
MARRRRKKVYTDLIDRYNDGLRQVADYIDYNLTDTALRPMARPDDGTAASKVDIDFGGITVHGYIFGVQEALALMGVRYITAPKEAYIRAIFRKLRRWCETRPASTPSNSESPSRSR